MLPIWLQVIHAVLYPLDYLYWRLGEARGYQWESDTWVIEGVRYSGEALRALAAAQGEVYKITRTGDCITVARIGCDSVISGDMCQFCGGDKAVAKIARSMGYRPDVAFNYAEELRQFITDWVATGAICLPEKGCAARDRLDRLFKRY